MRTRTTAVAAAIALSFGVLAAAPSAAAPQEPDGVTIKRGPGFSAADVGPAAANVRGGSIVFVRGGNIWLIRGDGSGLYQVTGGGGYEAPSMSANGLIAAMRGDLLVVMRQNGQVLSAFEPSDLFPADPTTINLTPALEPVISPDGTKIAYSQGRLRSSGGNLVSESLTSVTSSAGPTLSRINIGMEPTWLTNSRVVYSDRGGIDIANVGAVGTNWFSAADIDPFFDDEWRFYPAYHPQLAPNGAHVVVEVEDRALVSSRVTGNPRTSVPGAPTASCFISDDGPEVDNIFSRGTYSPDSRALAYANRGVLTVLHNVDVCNSTSVERALLGGVTDPYWSSAALNPGPRPGARPPLTSKPALKSFRLAKRPKVTGTAKVRRKLKVTVGSWSPRPAAVSYRWYRGKKAVKGKVGAKRTYTLKKGDRGKRLRVKVTVRRAGYKTTTVWSTTTKKVKR